MGAKPTGLCILSYFCNPYYYVKITPLHDYVNLCKCFLDFTVNMIWLKKL